MSKELMDNLKWKKKIYRIWKWHLATWEEYRKIVRACKDAMRKT